MNLIKYIYIHDKKNQSNQNFDKLSNSSKPFKISSDLFNLSGLRLSKSNFINIFEAF